MSANNEIVRALKHARKLIKKGKCEFICVALRNTPNGELARHLILIRMGALDKLTVLEDWLMEHGVDVLAYDDVGTLMRDYRVRWLTALIKEFSA